MPTCPNGHQSGSDDWCEVCGHRMAGAGAVPPPPPPPPPAAGYGYPQQTDPGPQPELCPQCRTPREANAPFCEHCRWNFLTNTATSYTPAAPQQPLPGSGLPPGFQQSPQRPHAGEYTSSRPSQMNRPAEPLSGPPPGAPAPPAPPAPSSGFGGGDDDWMLAPPPGQSAQAPQQAPQQHGQHPLAPPPGQYGGQQGGQNGGQQGGQQGYGYPQQTQAPHGPQAPQAPMGWSATIGPDREYFMAMMHRSGPEASGLNLPAYSPEQRRELVGNQITIGRRRHSTGDTPDIDLSVPPEDPGVSHQHAVLVQQPDGSWAVVDQNSTNGTTVNGGEEAIQPFVPVPLQDGDRVHVGAWTTITIHRG
ncbi:FHA domain-containing protein [Streptomyces apocyni]|uniref:FHA domain-containing protein n=1 Tax=Streptomyces apocyni TaxID=2654677 RepID=UPI0012E9C197|nr:FHA domain-containing protein [Streptomyces apocyni]